MDLIVLQQEIGDEEDPDGKGNAEEEVEGHKNADGQGDDADQPGQRGPEAEKTK